MLYYFDKNKLKYKIARKTMIAIIAIPLLAITSAALSFINKTEDVEPKEKGLVKFKDLERDEVILMVNQVDEFTEKKLVSYILELNIKFPDIAFAQARYESGNWGKNPNANIFESNNNLFGMKEAIRRPTTCRGTQRGHAFYDNWRLSVMDYAMWQHSYTKQLKTRSAYIEYLKANYAMGTYESIMQIIRETRIKYPELIVRDYPKLE